LKKILFVANVDWFFISHRLIIAEKAKALGYDVYVACGDSGRSQEIKDKNLKFIDLKFSRSGTKLSEELKSLYKFYSLYKKLRPDIVHHITLKPVIYGSVASKLTKVNATLNAISGLGYNFTGSRKSITQKVMIRFMRFGFNQKNIATIFQNQDDYKEVKSLGVLNNSNMIYFIKGSGVDLDQFNYSEPNPKSLIRILFPVRMLWDKGVKELREASVLLKENYLDIIQFILSGLADTENKAGVTPEYLKDWSDGKYVKWIGYQKDMVSVYKNSDIVVLPSYREGMPRTLIEACAMGRPIITTDAIGCRECVDEGINGFKVAVKSSEQLARAIEKLILNPVLIRKMGKASRTKAEAEFDVNNVVDKHMNIYKDLLS